MTNEQLDRKGKYESQILFTNLHLQIWFYHVLNTLYPIKNLEWVLRADEVITICSELRWSDYVLLLLMAPTGEVTVSLQAMELEIIYIPGSD